MFLLLGARAAYGLDLDSNYVETIRRGIAFSITEQFDSAKAQFEPMIVADSTDCGAYFFLAAVYHSQMMDAEDFAQVDTFQVLLDDAYRHAEAAIKVGDNPAWALFIEGCTHAYRAALETHIGSWFKAMKEAVKGKNRCLDALRIDPNFWDAYVILGNYHYWKSARTDFINWLPLVADRKEQGVEELRLAADSSLVSRDLALNSLVWVLLDADRDQEALAAAQDLYGRYPSSRLANWAMAFADLHAGKLHQATKHFQAIVDQLEPDTTQNYFNLIECRYHLAKIYQEAGDEEATASEYRKMLAYPVDEEIRKRQSDKLKEARHFIDGISQPR